MDAMKKKELQIFAAKARIGVIEGVYNAKAGHPGGSLSICDLLAYLYNGEMSIDASNPHMEDRDRFVLSKGHAAPALYATLALKGFFPVEDLKTLRKSDSYLQGHPNMNKIPGVDMSTGSLGQGISAAVGMALGAKLDKKDFRVYTVLGDGEIEEGEVWEAAMFAAHQNLDHLIAMTDWNGQQIDGTVDAVAGEGDLESKWKSFGWNVIVADGHDFESILAAFAKAKESTGAPVMILFKTDMGHGVDFMSGTCKWHGKAPSQEQCTAALAQLEETLGDY